LRSRDATKAIIVARVISTDTQMNDTYKQLKKTIGSGEGPINIRFGGDLALFLVFGSLPVPIKAIVLNLLSLTATFGAIMWIFQGGHLSGVLNFTAAGRLDVTMPILMFCIAVGLSMDYEVFLLSRIKEEHDVTGDNLAGEANWWAPAWMPRLHERIGVSESGAPRE
jgi:hypothetical protein